MSSNTITARVAFSFQGASHDLETIVDLDHCLDEEAPNFHLLLAKASGIDPYSYLYEVLESYEIEFSQPTGAAVHSCVDGAFDWFHFQQDAREEADMQVVGHIAQRLLGVADLAARDDLKAALLAAYRAGKETGSRT